MIVTMVPPKAGRLATGSYGEKSPITGSVFGNRPRIASPHPEEGGLAMDNDRTKTVYANSLSDYHNTTTQKTEPPRVVFYSEEVPVHAAPSIQPHEKGTFFQTKIFPVNDMKFGGSKGSPSDTAFHAEPEREIPRPTPRSAIDGAHVEAVSFNSHNNLWYDQNNSFINGQSTPANPDRTGAGRWNVTKKGAAQ